MRPLPAWLQLQLNMYYHVWEGEVWCVRRRVSSYLFLWRRVLMTFEADVLQPAAALHLPRLNPVPPKPRRASNAPVASSSSATSVTETNENPLDGESFKAAMFLCLPKS